MHINEPDFWLVLELDGELKAVNPTQLLARDPDAEFLVGIALGYHEGHPGRRLVFTSDLTEWLASAGLTWSHLDIANDVARLMSAARGRTQAPI
jgi:hypothetical protein